MIRGTRMMIGDEAQRFSRMTNNFKELLWGKGFQEIILPSIWETETFTKKAGEEVVNQMYTFKDKGDRDICLIPEVTALVQQLYNEQFKAMKKPIRLFYSSRCYRYERPQAGRYREFWQFGIEVLNPGRGNEYLDECKDLAREMLISAGLTDADIEIDGNAVRGLNYYIGNGFEIKVPALGAQKQVVGGGTYAEGIGFAIGVDRLMLALSQKEEK